MASAIVRAADIWRLAEQQHGVVARGQLLAAGFTSSAIKHRVRRGRLHRIRSGVYAVGRREVGRHGEWMAALLACGPEAVLSHGTAAAVLGLRTERGTVIEVTVPAVVRRAPAGVIVYRRRVDQDEITACHRMRTTGATRTLVDLASGLGRGALEAAINQADKLDLIDPEALRAALERYAGRPGVATLRTTLDRHTFVLTDSGLERRFMAIVRRLGLPAPEKRRVNGFKVDFAWPDLGLIVETDGLRYHRTPATQARDLRRDQTHRAAGLMPLRFSHSQVRYEAPWVEHCLARAVHQLLA